MIAKRALTIEAHKIAMKKSWPKFRFISLRNGAARWLGDVKPQFQTYRIEIILTRDFWPEVRVRSPELTRLPDNEEGELPHVYPPSSDPTLCLFDPKTDEWDATMTIAETIMPWVLDWLACYELWLMTGKWTGGGRHVLETSNERSHNLGIEA